MKKLSVIVVVMMMAVGAFAASNEVYSVNSVGFIRTNVGAGQWEIIALPFEALDGSASSTISAILPDAPDGTVVQVYRNGAWVKEEKLPFVGWDPDTTEFIRGDAVFVKAPDGAATEYTVMGEVPSAQTAPSTTTVIPAGSSMAGYAYPADIPLEDTSLALLAAENDIVYSWNPEKNGGEGGYDKVEKLPFVGWDPAGTILKAGKGYFIVASASIDWVEVKPYVWP